MPDHSCAEFITHLFACSEFPPMSSSSTDSKHPQSLKIYMCTLTCECNHWQPLCPNVHTAMHILLDHIHLHPTAWPLKSHSWHHVMMIHMYLTIVTCSGLINYPSTHFLPPSTSSLHDCNGCILPFSSYLISTSILSWCLSYLFTYLWLWLSQ